MSEEARAIEERRAQIRERNVENALVRAFQAGCVSLFGVLVVLPRYAKVPPHRSVLLVVCPTMFTYLQQGISGQAPGRWDGPSAPRQWRDRE